LKEGLRTVGAAILLFSVVASASANPILLSSVPKPGARINSGDVEFRLRFNGYVDRERSRIYLTHPNGSLEYLEVFEAGSPVELLGTATRLSPGVYQLHWVALQADGGATRGSLRFRVAAR
jgi:methionine-rich copper-binding protein CopC